MKSLYKFLCFLFLIASISGCQFWRWYQLKKQLRDISKYFAIERVYKDGKKEDFITMKKPVLKSSNIFFLTKKAPTLVKELPKGKVEIFSCVRESDEKYSFDIKAYYNADGYLYRIDPPNILTNAYDDYTYVRIAQEILLGKVDALNYEIKATYKKDNENFDILDRARIIKYLGKPDNKSTEQSYTYSYKIDTITEATDDIHLNVSLIFAFSPNGVIKNIHFNFETVNLYFNYSEIIEL